MALTRKFLSALGIDADKVEEIINAHTEVTDALKNERDSYKADAEKLPEVQKELDSFKKAAEELDGKNPFEVKYNAIKEEYEQYKADIEAKATKAAKSDAYRALLKEAGVADKRIDAVLRVSDVDGIELDKDGKVKNSDKHLTSIKEEWADFIDAKEQKRVDTGGSMQNKGTGMTIDEIMAIEDDAARQDAIAENHTLFGF